MVITFVLKDVQADFMPIILPNSVYLNALQFQMTHLLKIHQIFVWANALLELLEVHKISIASHHAGGQILLIKQQDCVLKFVLMVILHKTKRPDAQKIVIQIHMQIRLQKDVS